MLTFYCPSCWQVIPEAAPVCPHCSAELAQLFRERDYISKLIAALSHREPETPIRAASILGKLHAREAVGPLSEVLRSRADPFIKAAALEALGNIGGADSQLLLQEYGKNGSVILNRTAQAALQRLYDNLTPAVRA